MTSHVFISGMHKSGTSLFRSLLDGHSRLAVVPFETHFFQNTGYEIKNAFRSSKKETLSITQKKQKLREVINHYNTVNNPYADVELAGHFNFDVFDVEFKNECESDVQLFDLFCQASLKSLNKDFSISEKIVVEKSVENSECIDTMRELFPGSKHIFIVRNPYANIVSLRKFRTKSGVGFPLLSRVGSVLQSNFSNLEKQKDMHDVMVVKYEDLVSETEKIMKRVADFIEIPFEFSLLNPTVMKNEWKGNSTLKQSDEKISMQSIEAWKNEILPCEIRMVNRIVSKQQLSDFGYSFSPYVSGWLRKAEGEPLHKYLANRIYLA